MQSVEKKKPKFNFFDVMIISILILVAVSAVYMNVMTEKEISATENGTDGFEYLLKADKIDNDFIALLTVGDTLYEYETGTEIGKIKSISAWNYFESYTDGDTTEYRQVQGYSNVKIKLDCNGTIYEDEYGIDNISINGYTTRVGGSIKVRNWQLVFDAECLLAQEE